MEAGGRRTLWTIWLARNKWIFQHNKLRESNIRELILVRVAQWGEAAKILTIGYSPEWHLNPVGILSAMHYKLSRQFLNSLCEAYEFVCTADGAWNLRVDGTVGGGIGGQIVHSSGTTLYTFSGPFEAWNNHEAEVAAIMHLLYVIHLKGFQNKKIVICTDSTVTLMLSTEAFSMISLYYYQTSMLIPF